MNKAHVFKKYGKNTIWLLSEKIIRLTFGFFLAIWMARYLGPEKLGILSYTQSYVSLFVIFSTLGLDSIVVKELVKNENEIGKVLGASTFLRLISSSICFAFVIISTLIFRDLGVLEEKVMIILSFLLLFNFFNLFDCYYQSQVKGRIISIIKISSLLITSVLKAYGIYAKKELSFFAYMIVLELIITSAFFLFHFFLIKKEEYNWSIDFPYAVILLRQSWPLIFSGFFISVYMKIDQIMINNMLGTYEVGIYSAAVRLSELWYFIPTVLSASLFPLMVKEKGRGDFFFKRRMEKIYFAVFWSAIFLSFSISFFGNDIISILYGDGFSESTTPLIIHIWCTVFVFLGVFVANQVVIYNKQNLLMYGVSIGAISNVIANFYFIPSYGIEGAAYATLLSQAFSSYFYLLLFPSSRYIFKFVMFSIFNIRLFAK